MNYKKIYWGFIFFIDIRIGNFDLLPDAIGYILMFIGLSALAQNNKRFKIAKWSSIPLIILSLPDIYQVPSIINEFVIPSTNIQMLGLCLVLINLILVYNICYGISEEAGKLNLMELAKEAIGRWKFFFACHCVGAIIFVFSDIIGVLILVAIATGVALMIAYLSIIELMNTASKELEVKLIM